jgi:hypothetical protein
VEISLVFQKHPDEDVWEQYAFGRLGGKKLAALEEHLLICERCQNTLASTDEFVLLMKRGTASFTSSPKQAHPGKVLPFGAGRRHVPKYAAVGAIAVASVAALVWIAPETFLRHPAAAHGAAMPVALQSLRSGSTAAMNRAPVGHPLDLSISFRAMPPSAHYRAEVVTSRGKTVWTGQADVNHGALQTRVGINLAKGIYWVRLYAPSSELLAEYGLKIE